MPAAAAKTNFGAVLDAAQRKPVTISKKRKLERLRREVRKGMDQLDEGKSTDGRAFMKSLMHQLD